MAYNKVILEGRICSDIEMKQTQSGVEYCNFSMAVDRDYKSGEERQADFIPVKAWRGSASFINKYFRKGDPILIDGRLEVNKYTDTDGNNKTFTSVVVDHCTFTIGKSGQVQQHTTGSGNIDDLSKFPNVQFKETDDGGELPF